jgi:hypothetical protein
MPAARSSTGATAAAAAFVFLALLASPLPASAHDWIGAKGTPDCECLPHVGKLDCASIAPIEKAWKTLVSLKCNATVATSGAKAAAKAKVEMLVDATAANATAAAPAPAHAAHAGHEESEDAALPARVYRCQVDQRCYEAYQLVIAHHYGCAPDFLPLAIAEGIHGFQTPASPVEEDGSAAPDTICQGCFQPRYMKTKGARPPMCPPLSCHHNEEALLGNLTVAADAGCAKDCSSETCKTAYQFLRVHHEGCVLNDNPMPSRLAADRLRDACRAHECTFSNGTYAAGNYTVDCKANEKNKGPFRAPLAELMGEEEEEVALDHSAHDHGAASTAPSNVPPAASSAVAVQVSMSVVMMAAAVVVMA